MGKRIFGKLEGNRIVTFNFFEGDEIKFLLYCDQDKSDFIKFHFDVQNLPVSALDLPSFEYRFISLANILSNLL